MKTDPKYIGVPNINFSVADKEDKRERSYAKQRIKRGFDDSELWSLDCTIAQFILPRLIEFKKQTEGYPAHMAGESEWHENLEKMILAFKLVVDGKLIVTHETSIRFKKFDEGISLFKDHFLNLWI